MINRNDYNTILNEYFDIEHNETRKIMLAIDENDQNSVLNALTSKLYDSIVNKVDDIDFGSIPETKGDITKLENYDKLVECINVMEGLLKEFKQDAKPIHDIKSALKNIETRKDLFERGFKLNIELPMVLYSTITLSIVSSISFLISSCVEFIKSPAEEDFKVTIDKISLVKSKQNLLFTNLDKFNKACDKGQIDNALDYVMKNATKNLTGMETGVVVGSIALVGLLLNIIPILRELIFFFYYSRTRMSDYFEIQADLLQVNAYNIQNNQSINKKEREAIAKKQLKIVEMFRKLSNRLAIEVKTTEVKAEKAISNEKKQYKTSDIVDSVPDSASSILF